MSLILRHPSPTSQSWLNSFKLPNLLVTGLKTNYPISSPLMWYLFEGTSLIYIERGIAIAYKILA